jgi:hypothetical protein
MKSTETPERRIVYVGAPVGLALVLSASLFGTGCGADAGPGKADGGCVAGQVGCPCSDGEPCDQCECVNGVCADCTRGAIGCVCLDNGMCNAGGVCGADRVCAACENGQKSCACKRGELCNDRLVCQQNLCVDNPCPDGSRGCPCKAGKVCNGNLHCGDNQLCADCTNDIVTCPCDAASQCQNHLVCDVASQQCREALTCVKLACVAHRQCQAGEAGIDSACLERCDDGWRWNSGDRACDELTCTPSAPLSIADDCASSRRECLSGVGGGAVCGGCLSGFTDEGGTLAECRVVKTCALQGCDAENRLCTQETSHTDAACGGCKEGWVDNGGTCFVTSCNPAEPGSIVALCAGIRRACDASATSAACGACLPGNLEDAQHICRELRSCDPQDLDCAGKLRSCEGSLPTQSCGACVPGAQVDPQDPTRCVPSPTCTTTTCSDPTPFCIDDGGGAHHCEAAKCGPGEAWSTFTSPPSCVTCYVNCTDSSESKTGRVWPYTLQGSTECLCETKPGSYWENAGKTTYACDRDGDGWVRKEGREKVRSSDAALRQNARCSLRTIDRFALENEYRQRMEIFLCKGDPFFATDVARCPSGLRTLDLYETARNDDQSLLDRSNDAVAPLYRANGVGRRLRANEVSSLTRACISTTADYNDNALSDIGEWHGNMTATDPDQLLFQNFGYYLELDRGHFEVGASVFSGSFVIQERPRCDAQAGKLALNYGPAAGEYWKECARSRDATYNGADQTPDLGMEFARWSCEGASGTCPIPPPPTETAPQAGQVPAHGACQVSGPLVDSECVQSGAQWPCVNGAVWRGMSHHSQFKCVVVSSSPSTTEPHLAAADINGKNYVLNMCRVSCPPGDPTCAADCSGLGCAASSGAPQSAPETNEPVLSCAAQASAADGQVGLVAVAYGGGTDYAKGCVNEWQPVSSVDPNREPLVRPWRSLCPGWTNDPTSVLGQDNQLNFGELQCGCGNNYGGLDCKVGCPGDPAAGGEVHLSPGYQSTPRQGVWLCGDFAASACVGASCAEAFQGVDNQGVQTNIHGEIPSSTGNGTSMCQDPSNCSTGFSVR